MQINRLYSAIVRGTWYLSEHHVDGYRPLIEAMQRGQWPDTRPSAQQRPRPVSMEDDQPQRPPEPVTTFGLDGELYDDPWYYDFVPVLTPDGLLAVPVMDVLTKYDYCGTAGTSTIARWLTQADADERVKAVLLMVDSPGGSVDGTAALARVVADFGKPLAAYCDGLMCSAAYYIACGADAVYCQEPGDVVGSVGVMCSWVDVAGIWEQKGATVHEVYADTSSKKNASFRAAKKKDYKPLKASMLNPMDELFMQWVQQHRPDVSQDALDGQEYLAQDAGAEGLIDGIRPMADVVAELLAEAQQPDGTGESSNPKSPQKTKMSLLDTIMGVFSASRAENPTPEQQQAAIAAAEQLRQEVVTLESSVTALTDQVTALTAERDAAVQARDAALTARTEAEAAQRQAEQERDEAVNARGQVEQDLADERTAHAETRRVAGLPASSGTNAVKTGGEPLTVVAGVKVETLPHIQEAREKLGLN